jgi:lysozyme family protein
MSSNVINSTPFLRTSREYPQEDMHELAVEINKTYVDVANAVNQRSIGLYPTNRPAVTGNSYFFTSQRLQELRQVYTFTSFGTIKHGINTANIVGFSQMYGSFTDGSIWYPLPYVNATAANNQVSITVDATNINVTAGAGAPPTPTRGWVVLAWISDY